MFNYLTTPTATIKNLVCFVRATCKVAHQFNSILFPLVRVVQYMLPYIKHCVMFVCAGMTFPDLKVDPSHNNKSLRMGRLGYEG